MPSKDVERDTSSIIAAWQDAIAASAEVLRCHAIVKVPADSADWIDSGLAVVAGDSITLLAIGAARLSEDPPIAFPANLFLWRRIGSAGRIDKLAAPTMTFQAKEAGSLMLVAHYPGAWRDETGAFDPDWPRDAAKGSYDVAILVWRGSADDGLALFAARDASGIAREAHDKLAAPVRLPRGWRPLWRVGATEVYREKFEATDSPRILCRCGSDAAIIEYPVDFPLEETTRLSWHWRVTLLPSAVGEDTLPTHDYLSIAVGFDNGLDLTYMWSAALPVGTSFRCPLPWWNKRETHQVARSGTKELGRWLAEDQSVLADYRNAIGGTPPTRIVGIWLIAVAAAQGGRGDCEYRSIRLADGGTSVEIGP
jgi:hypothetical protein